MKGHSFINYNVLLFLPSFAFNALKESSEALHFLFYVEVINIKKALLTLPSTEAIFYSIGGKGKQEKGRFSVPFNDRAENHHQASAITSLHDKLPDLHIYFGTNCTSLIN